jgi:hypothetical protein
MRRNLAQFAASVLLFGCARVTPTANTSAESAGRGSAGTPILAGVDAGIAIAPNPGAPAPIDMIIPSGPCFNCLALPSCGDGFVQPEFGEQCESGKVDVTCPMLLGSGAIGSVECKNCRYDTSFCKDAHALLDAGDDAGNEWSGDAQTMNCIPGNACHVSNDGICAPDGEHCNTCQSHAECAHAYGANPRMSLCVQGSCAECDAQHACLSGWYCFGGRCSIPL